MIRHLETLLGPEHRGRLRSYLAWVTAYAVLQGIAASLLVPVAEALLRGDTDGAARWIGVLAGVVAVTCVAHYVQAMRGYGVAIIVLTTMHEKLGDHVATLPLGWFTPEKTGRLARIATGGTQMVAALFAHLIQPLVVGVVTPATIAIAMLFFDWRLALVALAASPVLYLAFRTAGRWVGKADILDEAAAVTAANRVVEYARAQRVLRAFGRSIEGHAPLEDALTEQRRAGRRTLRYAVSGLILSGITVQTAFTVLIVVAMALAVDGRLDAVPAVAIVALIARFIGPLTEVADYAGVLRIVRNDLARLTAVLEEKALPEAGGRAGLPRPGEIEMDGVTFGYEPDTPVLRDVSVRIPPRTMAALVGPSGSGKTTVTRLIARFWDTDAGTVRVGGTDVREQPTEQLMEQVSLVFQDVYLFDDTLAANIRVGRSDATDAEVTEAARLAGVLEIVERLPGGWDTRVGEGGMSLSGGERQRVSLARALLKDAPIVLLDEATAALDPHNERYVQRSLRRLAERSTLLVIAHRLPTVVAADQIIVLDETGSVTQRGTHEELLASGGRYADFWASRDHARGWRLTT